ncbi:MAG: T9SS C-terminal target domain-containing protein [Flavobacteriales bacterium]|nr:hypothetical protein [Flavobacteriales bacterium]MCB9167009.1 T9SS C-terminal target domain-containing protein [Flavobacteriales bacterium]
MLKRSFFTVSVCLSIPSADAQIEGRGLVLEEVSIPGMPGLQAFAWGQHDGQWLLIGGRTDGLHRRQPPFTFLASDNNTSAWVVDPVLEQVWSTPLSGLPTALYEQLQSTNMEFQQRGDVLYMIGGYGYSGTAGDHVTHARITAVDVSSCISAIKTGGAIAPFFRSLADTRMQVTGGQLGMEGGHFLLVGGQRFMGRYNPIGPDFGPGFEQQYTNAIRSFEVTDDGTTLGILDYTEVIDTTDLHRRDYNMLPQVFPDGSFGHTVFSGVFRYDQDLPWLNTVDLHGTSFSVVPDFEQLLNQYHTAHLAAWDSLANSMSNVFFGGIGEFFFDQNGVLWDDPNVPFVRTISLVRRDLNGELTETAIGDMPGLLGAAGEFIPWQEAPFDANGMLRLHDLAGDTILVGHIVGGIESSAENIFFVNTGTQSDAAPRVFRVYLTSLATKVPDLTEMDGALIAIEGPMDGAALRVRITLPERSSIQLLVLDASGRSLRTVFQGLMPAGQRVLSVPVDDLPSGAFLLELTGSAGTRSLRFVR